MLGEIPRWSCAQWDWPLSLREFQFCLYTLMDSFLFRARRRPSCPPLFFLPGTCEEKAAGQRIEQPVTSELTLAQCPHASPSPQREHSPVLFTQHDQRPSATWSCLVWVTLKWMTTFLWQFQTRKSYRALWPNPPSCRHLLRAKPDSEWMKSLWQRLSMSSGPKGLRLRNHLAAGWTSGFIRSAIRLSANSCPPSSQKYTTSSQNRGVPPTRLASVLLLQLLSHPLTCSLRDLRSTTDLALRATKATAQAIGRSMSSLIVLECHLWLTITEMKEAVKVPFLDTPLSSGSLFGPAVEGFAECYTEAQKTSQAMRHFLPKRTSSSSATSHPRPAPTQQTAKPMSTALEPRPAEGQRDRGRSRLARCYPFPKRQGPRPKIALDPAPQKSSWTASQKEEGLATAGQLRKQPLFCLSPPRLELGAEESVYGFSRAHYSVQVYDRCDSGQNITHTFSKIYFSAYHKRPALHIIHGENIRMG